MLLYFLIISAGLTTPILDTSSGLVLEPVVGGLFLDARDENKLIGGVRASFLNPDPSDALITGEMEALSATQVSGAGKTPRSDFLTNAGLQFYEFYHPMVFRASLGGGIELRDDEINPTAYYRGGLGHYINSRWGFFIDASGRILLRDDHRSYPIEVGLSMQLILF